MKKIIFYSLLSFMFAGIASAADIVSRPTTTTAGKAASRARPVATSVRASTAVVPEPVVPEVVPEEQVAAEVVEEEPTIDSEKASKFSAALNGQSVDGGGSDLKDLIKAQRTADESSISISSGNARKIAASASGRNSCDDGLRSCMKEKCGDNFKNCALNTDLLWGEKIESCRISLKCTGEEYAAFAPEIKADRDSYQLLGSFVEVQSCGSEYNECLVSGCGTQLHGCLKKAAGDKVISGCSKIAEKCRTADSGLAARAMDVLGTMRQDTEKQVVTDEKELYALRDKMEAQCKSLGAMYDDRSMSCVFSAEFWIAGNRNPFASKKVYAGKTFDCTQEWFGVDVTTYKEDAARLTREQTAATSALMGAGVGTLTGKLTNSVMKGGFGKTDQQDNADKANDVYKQECEVQGGTIKSGKCDVSLIKEDADETGKKLKELKTQKDKKK
jgi:hypothetical protein